MTDLPVYEVEEISIEQALRMLGSGRGASRTLNAYDPLRAASAPPHMDVQQLVFHKNAVRQELAQPGEVFSQL